MQNSFKTYIIRILIILGLSFTSCKQVTIKLDKIPANTPQGSKIYITGNFNFWDPGDESYVLDYEKGRGYSITLPASFGDIEYKFTRGDWTTVERDRCGNDINNRVISNKDKEVVASKIESWADLDPLDCDSITIVVNQIPKNTPKDAQLRIAGNFNAWNPLNNPQYLLKRDTTFGKYSVVLKKKNGLLLKDFRFKIIRNSLSQSEADKYGNEIETRSIDLSQGEKMEVSIDNWSDLVDPSLNTVTIILPRIPKSTPENSQIYLAGNFNDWKPGDPNYIFRKKSNGFYAISIPRLKYGLSFKVTRGSWGSEATDNKGNIFGNQDYNYSDVDTIYFGFDNWKDLKPVKLPYITFVIDKVPKNTPPEDNLYMACSQNRWKTDQPQFYFNKKGDGTYVLNVGRSFQDLEYKITRGSWQNQEILVKESRVSPHDADTVHIQIAGWSDLLNHKTDFVKIEIIKLPKNTSPDAKIYIAGGFNAWNSGHFDFRLTKDSKGTFFIVLPRVWLKQGFKFTQGSWELVEGDKRENFLENRYYHGNADILRLGIESWED